MLVGEKIIEYLSSGLKDTTFEIFQKGCMDTAILNFQSNLIYQFLKMANTAAFLFVMLNSDIFG